MSEIKGYLESGFTFVPAVVCFLKKDNKVLLGLRKKVSLGLGENLIAGIGGKVGDHPEYANETLEEALVREVLEEIGVTLTSYRKMGRVRFICPEKPKWSQDVTVFVADAWQGEPIETEAMKPMWFDISDLPKERMWDDNKYWIPNILAGKLINMVFLLDGSSKVQESLVE